MISYAQNFEDVILNRVFCGKTDGFYIDVGAWDPVIDSVTKFFYDQGWSGINIEPNELYYQKLKQERPRDTILNLALGDRDESRTFYAFELYGISTFDEVHRNRFVERGYESTEKTVNVTTLAAVCQEYVTGQIDFLKIDCEGWEKFVLKGTNWERFRPIVLVVEATEPGTTVPTWHEWEPLIENAGYDKVYFDGLNCFYLARECSGLRSHFELPPNFHDEFQAYATVSAQGYSQVLEQERDSLKASISELQGKLKQAADERVMEDERSLRHQTQLGDLQESLKHTSVEYLKLNEQNARDRMELDKSRKEAEASAAKIQLLESELVTTRTRMAELDRTILETRLWVSQLSQELAAGKERR